MRAALALSACCLALAACGEKEEPAPGDIGARAAEIRATVDLEKAPPGAPDAGTQGGHNAPDGIASTREDEFEFSGTIKPASAQLTAEGGDLQRGEAGRFTVVMTDLKRGPNRVTLTATAPGAREWTYEASITRR